MASKAAARIKIKSLIEKYEKFKLTSEYSTLSEEATCLKFILPLFRYLGWNFEGDEDNMDEVQAQAPVANQKRVDYAFNINGQVSFFLEAKKLSEDLGSEEFAWQAINYGYNRSVKFVVLSDFEGLVVFNTAVKSKRISDKTVIKFKYTDYLSKLDELWLLSKDSISRGKLNEHANINGHVENKVPVNELLLSKLLVWRDKLMKQIKGDNPGLTTEDVAECVQKLLNRLIFIRTCEDRKIDTEKHLLNLTKEWQADDSKSLYKMLQVTFKNFEEGYDSSLFDAHEVDKLKISDNLLDDIIKGLYEDPKEDVSFDFAVIDADILGSIYEQYLGTIQRGENLKGKEKRKSHGIYYTPKYIVDYIVKNTLGKVIDDLIKNKEYSKIGKLKVLDPACGSGSFLLKALQAFDEGYAKIPEGKNDPNMQKIKALKQNIYGVDLDDEAIELTKLNLLLSTVSARKKLPDLDHNIECGNSLIEDSKIVGDMAFKWETRFKDVMDKGMFDVIIGNPPWGADIKGGDRDYLSERWPEAADYESSQYFVLKSLSLLNSTGILGMIIPNTFALNVFAKACRESVLSHMDVYSITDLSNIDVFADAGVRSIVIILGPKRKAKCHIYKLYNDPHKLERLRSVSQEELLLAETWKKFLVNETPLTKIVNQIIGSHGTLSEICDVRQGYIPYRTTTLTKRYGATKAKEIVGKRLWHANKRIDSRYLRELQGADVGRYSLGWSGVWVKYGEWVSTYLPISNFSGPRLLIREITGHLPYSLLTTYTSDTFVHNPSVLAVLPKTPKLSPKYILGILNSKLMSIIFSQVAPKSTKGLFPKIIITDAKRLPFPNIDLSRPNNKRNYENIIEMVDKMIKLNRDPISKQTSSADRLRRQIDDINSDIDKIVYKIYGLTDEEICVVKGET